MNRNKQRAVAMIDPSWLLGHASQPTRGIVQGIQRAVGNKIQLERIYWYFETDGTPIPHSPVPLVSLRVVARDDLDDGYELIRAIHGDIRSIAGVRSYDALIIASHDDRLALTIEHAQSNGLYVIGCATAVDEPDPRIQRIVDELVDLSVPIEKASESPEPPSSETIDVIEAAISLWIEEAHPDELTRTKVHIEGRPGLPRPADSRLLYLVRSNLGRELSQPERITLRSRFRQAITLNLDAKTGQSDQ